MRPSSRRNNAAAAVDAHELDVRLSGAVFTPAGDGWDAARAAWNLAVDQQPAAVVCPVDEGDVAEAVAYARETGLRIAPQCTGHNGVPLGALDRTILTPARRGGDAPAAARMSRSPRRSWCSSNERPEVALAAGWAGLLATPPRRPALGDLLGERAVQRARLLQRDAVLGPFEQPQRWCERGARGFALDGPRVG
jgi:hypothetical protein